MGGKKIKRKVSFLLFDYGRKMKRKNKKLVVLTQKNCRSIMRRKLTSTKKIFQRHLYPFKQMDRVTRRDVVLYMSLKNRKNIYLIKRIVK